MKTECSKCGEFLELQRIGRQRYCLKCHAAYMRAHRPKFSEMTPEQRQRSTSRAYANVYQHRGKLQPQPCEACGAMEAQKHHDDYSKPLAVRWFCRHCHLKHHRDALCAADR